MGQPSKRFISTKSERSTRSPTSSVRRSAWICSASERIIASAVPTGCGFIEIAHGRCSVPAPAVGELLRGVPLAESSVAFELTTPTGAAILAALADGFGPLPAMTIDRIGYGAGSRDLEEQANLLRLLVGEATPATASDQVTVLETNLDDASGELIGYAIARLWAAGALDVYSSRHRDEKEPARRSPECHLPRG